MYARIYKRLSLLIILISISACEKAQFSPVELYSHLYLRLTTALKIHFVHPALFNETIALNESKAWVKILDIDSTCLMSKAPYKKARSWYSLRLVEKKMKQSCDEALFNENAITLDFIRSLKISLSPNLERPFYLNLELFHKKTDDLRGEKLVWKIPLFNIQKNHLSIEIVHSPAKKQRYANSSMDQIFPGVKVLNSQHIKSQKVLNDGDICHLISSECKSIGQNNCYQCPGSWYEVKIGGCPMSGIKYCGVNRCGEKGKEACSSGVPLSVHTNKDFCQPDTPFGICEQGLMATCVGSETGDLLLCL